MKNICRIFLSFMLAVTLARAADVIPFHARDGLANFRAKAEQGEEVRVAYFGGSITAEAGWRTLSFDYLKKQFPKASFVEVFAAAPGTGSDLGVCRLGNDVLRHAPDLLFVEFAVNDETTPDEKVVRTMEAIVRQAWKAYPDMDICFVYTMSFRGLPDLQAGNYTRTVRTMERVAGYYGVPSVHMAASVARRIERGEFVFGKKGGTTESELTRGQRVFTRDSVHPTPDGHAVYMESLAQALPVLFSAGNAGRPHLTGGLLENEGTWENATILPIESLRRTIDWTLLDPNDPHVAQQAGRIAPPTWGASEQGASIEFTMNGPLLGLVGMCSPDSGQFSVSVDDREPVLVTFFDRFVRPDFIRMSAWFYPQPLGDGPHRVRIELTGAPLNKEAIKGEPLEDPVAYLGLGAYLGGVLVFQDKDDPGLPRY